MRLPGFNAETSLYRSSLAYCGVADRGVGRRDAPVMPAIFFDPCRYLSGCAGEKCRCELSGGNWHLIGLGPCFHSCVRGCTLTEGDCNSCLTTDTGQMQCCLGAEFSPPIRPWIVECNDGTVTKGCKACT